MYNKSIRLYNKNNTNYHKLFVFINYVTTKPYYLFGSTRKRNLLRICKNIIEFEMKIKKKRS